MDRKPTFFNIVTSSILSLILQVQPAGASPTYRWIDDNGNPTEVGGPTGDGGGRRRRERILAARAGDDSRRAGVAPTLDCRPK